MFFSPIYVLSTDTYTFLIFTYSLAGHAHGEPSPLALSERAQGLAIGLVQDRLHRKAVISAYAGHAHARPDLIPAGRRHAGHPAGGRGLPRGARLGVGLCRVHGGAVPQVSGAE